ncbi:hypothetical protein GQ600_10027 [Phytophthora cactorum]|nr:hypothetical protein GQ600_10027 [Phytophthora cactorum]
MPLVALSLAESPSMRIYDHSMTSSISGRGRQYVGDSWELSQATLTAQSKRVWTAAGLYGSAENGSLAYKERLKEELKARKCWKILIGRRTKPERDRTPEAKARYKKWKEKVLQLNDILANTLDDGTTPQLKQIALAEDFEKKSSL